MISAAYELARLEAHRTLLAAQIDDKRGVLTLHQFTNGVKHRSVFATLPPAMNDLCSEYAECMAAITQLRAMMNLGPMIN